MREANRAIMATGQYGCVCFISLIRKSSKMAPALVINGLSYACEDG